MKSSKPLVRRFHSRALVTFLSWACLLAPVFAEDAARSENEIYTAWSKRQERFQRAKLVWKEHRVYTKGAIMSPEMAEMHNLGPEAVKNGVPLTETKFDIPCELAISGTMARYATDTLRLPDYKTRHEISLDHFVSSFDGTLTKIFFQSDQPRGGVLKRGRNNAISELTLKPLVLFFRPMDPEMGGLDTQSLKLSPERPMINGRPMLVLRAPRTVVWVDAERDYTVARWMWLSRQGDVTHLADVEHINKAGHGWLPATWRIDVTMSADDAVGEYIKARVTNVAIDPEFEKDYFNIAFPVGTEVHNAK